MPQWKKSSPELTERFARALPDDPLAQRKQMFGYPACFVNGNYFAGLHEETVVVRLPVGVKGKFPALSAAPVFDPRKTGRGMKDWWLIPAEIAASESRLEALLAELLAEVARLPPKTKTARAKPKRPAR